MYIPLKDSVMTRSEAFVSKQEHSYFLLIMKEICICIFMWGEVRVRKTHMPVFRGLFIYLFIYFVTDFFILESSDAWVSVCLLLCPVPGSSLFSPSGIRNVLKKTNNQKSQLFIYILFQKVAVETSCFKQYP